MDDSTDTDKGCYTDHGVSGYGMAAKLSRNDTMDDTFVKKMANGFGGALAGYMLAWIGYIPNAQQSPETLTGMLAMVSLVPAAFAFIALIAMYFYPLTEAKFQEILSELQARRAEIVATD